MKYVKEFPPTDDLYEQALQFAPLFDGLHQAVIVKDEASRFLYLNTQACVLLGAKLEDVIGCTDSDFLPKAEANEIRSIDLEVLTTGKQRVIEETITAADGTTRSLITHKHLATLPGTERRAIIVSISDVTELRRAENMLRAKEEHYRSLVELHPQIPWTADAAGDVTEIGPGWLDVSGSLPEKARDWGWADAVHPEDLLPVMKQWSLSVASGQPFDMEFRILGGDGGCRWFRNRAAPRRDDARNVVRWYGLLEDVHERRAAIDALLESETRFRIIADSVPVMIWLSDQAGEATYFNRLWTEVTGLTEAEALASGWLRTVHPDDRERITNAFVAATSTKSSVRVEYRLRRADGTWAWVIDDCVPRLSPEGILIGYAGSILDITERRNAELALQESEAVVRGIFESSPDCIRLLDLEGKPLLMNKAGRKLFGLGPVDPIENCGSENLFTATDWPTARLAHERAAEGFTTRFEARVRSSNGEICMDIMAAPVVGSSGDVNRVLTIWRDVSDAKAAREDAEVARTKAEDAVERLSAVLENTMDCVLVVDRSWRITYLNSNTQQLLGLDDKAIGAGLWDLYPTEADGVFANAYRKALDTGQAATFEAYFGGMDMWVEVHVSPTENGLSIFFRDTSVRRKAEQERFQAHKQIFHMSRHDALTGLPNRLLFQETLEKQLGEMADCASLAVLTLDLDGFKAVNDAYGHHAGDILLRQVADRLKLCARETDTIARLGGDEFAIVQPSADGAEVTEELAQRVIEAFEEPFDLEGVHASVGVSIGISVAPENGTLPEQLTRSSDMALYRAKAAGRGIYCTYEAGLDTDLKARQALKFALRNAVANRELELHYQPLVSLRDNTITTCEALLRWRHPDRGMVSPAEFIPVAEETGLIVSIGEWVLLEACRQALLWPEDVSVSVNLSPLQFKGGRLPEAVRSALKSSGIAPSRLQLEVTESVFLDENDFNLRTLQELRQMGVKIAMDDFGTGYSSLGYLRSFPFDKIKVDRSFIADLPEGRESLAIVRAVAGIGKSLGITTTVEGVETESQLGVVSSEGFDEAQGYLFSRPLPTIDVHRLLGAWAKAESVLDQVSEYDCSTRQR